MEQNQLLLEQELKRIHTKIINLELKENSWSTYLNNFFVIMKWKNGMENYLEKKAIWQSLKTNLEKNIKFIEELNNKDNASQYSTLLFKFSNLLSKVDERLAICEAKLSYLKVKEENSKLTRLFGFIVLIIIIIFILGSLAYKKWKQDKNKSVFDGLWD